MANDVRSIDHGTARDRAAAQDQRNGPVIIPALNLICA
jgi:hypothetical protein